MPSITATRQSPDLIFEKPRYEVYKAVYPRNIRIIEPLSLDEAGL